MFSRFTSSGSSGKETSNNDSKNVKSKNEESFILTKPAQPKVLALSDSIATIKCPAAILENSILPKFEDEKLMQLDKQWECLVCSYSNEDSLEQCFLCTTPRPLPIGALMSLSMIKPKEQPVEKAPKNDSFEYEIQYCRHKYTLDRWTSSGIYDTNRITLTKLEANQRYDIRVRIRKKKPALDENKKKTKPYKWSEFSDVITICTLHNDDQQRLDNLIRLNIFLQKGAKLLDVFKEDDAIPDRYIDKAARSVESVLTIARYSGFAPQVVSLAKNAWKLQKTGLAAVIFREDLQQLIVALATFANSVGSGIGLSSRDLTVGAYYLVWEKKRQRLMNPLLEFYSHKKLDINGNRTKGLLEEEAPAELLKELCWYMPLANMAYRRTPAEIQWVLDTFPSRLRSVNTDETTITAASIARMARRKSAAVSVQQQNPNNKDNNNKVSQASSNSDAPVMEPMLLKEAAKFSPKFRLIAARSNARKFKPAFFITCDEVDKIAIISIRGTHDVEDVLTDSLCDVKEAPFQFHSGKEKVGLEHQVHAGMLEAARWLFRGDDALLFATKMDNVEDEINHSTYASGPIFSGGGIGLAVKRLHKDGYKIRLTGHSLGGGVSVLLALLLADDIPDITLKVISYGTPACTDESLAEALKDGYNSKSEKILPDLAKRVSVISIILRDDIVPRLSMLSARQFVLELKKTRKQWEPLLKQDINGFAAKAKTIFAEPQRAHYNYNTNTNTSLNRLSEEEQEVVDVTEDMKKKQKKKPVKENERLKKALAHRLVPPGLIVHIYKHGSTYHASLIDYNFESLRSIQPFINSVDNHRLFHIRNASQEVFSVRQAKKKNNIGPIWESSLDQQKYSDRIECSVCRTYTGWSEGNSANSEIKNSVNCHSCGLICCTRCCKSRMSLPSIGINRLVSICDDCNYKLVFNSEVSAQGHLGIDLGPLIEFKSSSKSIL